MTNPEDRITAAFDGLSKDTNMVIPPPLPDSRRTSQANRFLVPALAMSAAIVVAVVGFVAFSGDGEPDLAGTPTTTSAPGTSAAPVTTGMPGTTASPETTTMPGTTAAPGSAAILTVEENGYFPWLFPSPTLSWYEEGCPSAESVARDFVANMDIDTDAPLSPGPATDLSQVLYVQARGENGAISETRSEITMARIDPGVVDCDAWAVLSVQSPGSVILTTPSGLTVGQNVIAAGAGNGFEATVGLRVVDETYDTRNPIGQAGAIAGWEGMEPFETVVKFSRAPIDANLILLAQSDWPVDGGAAPFAAIKLRHDASAVDPVEPVDPGLPAPLGLVAVVGVASDDVLNARSGPGVQNDIVGELSPFTIGTTRYDRHELSGGDTWTLIGSPESRDFDAWVNASFLSAVLGDAEQPAALYAQATAVREALALNQSALRLGDVIAGGGGTNIVISADGFIDPADQVLSVDDLGSAGSVNDVVRTWGAEDGTGDPIDMTIAEFFDDTSNAGAGDGDSIDTVAVNQRIKAGNTIDNMAEQFPDATIVELHDSGEPGEAADFTWSTIRLAFEPTADGGYGLVALAFDSWTI